jgi:hypothetical protein
MRAYSILSGDQEIPGTTFDGEKAASSISWN